MEFIFQKGDMNWDGGYSGNSVYGWMGGFRGCNFKQKNQGNIY